MSILKGILHHWNKTSSAYDTIHPETESAQVTDWNSGIVGTLASTALGSLVTTLSSDSLLAKLIEKVLSATGVKYQTGQNGYLCLGSLFGGLIIQWGFPTINGATPFSWPIAFTSFVACLSAFARDQADLKLEHVSFYNCTNDSVMLYSEDSTLRPVELTVSITAIGV